VDVAGDSQCFYTQVHPSLLKVSDSMKIIVDVALEFMWFVLLCFGTIILSPVSRRQGCFEHRFLAALADLLSVSISFHVYSCLREICFATFADGS
jgi:hypothetical protein